MIDENIEHNMERVESKERRLPELAKHKTDPLADKNMKR